MSSSAPNATPRLLQRPLIYVVGAAAAFYALFIARTSFSALGVRYFVLFEDAMISMRYARNFAEGNGLNWNAGEPPVEGYTNLLWTLWMASLHKIGITESKISLVVMLTGVVILFALAAVVRRLSVLLGASPAATIAAVTGTLFCYPLVFWTLRGMEVGAVSLIIHLILLMAMEIEDDFSFGKVLLMGFLGAASVLLRSDSALVVGGLGLYAAVFAPKGRKFLTLTTVGLMVGGTVIAHTLFRLGYYHEKLPNTAYLKLQNIGIKARVKRGFFVAFQVIAFHLAVPVAFLAGALWSSYPGGQLAQVFKDAMANGPLRRRWLCGAFVLLQVMYAIYVGGDAWEWMLYANRYMSAAMPAFILLVATAFAHVFELSRTDKVVAARIVLPLALALIGCGAILFILNGLAFRAPETGIARTIVVSKKTAGGGALFMLIGVVLIQFRVRLAAVLARLSEGATRWKAAPIALAAVIFLPGHLEPLSYWALHNAAQFQDEARYARLGILLARTTPKDFRIAVVAAGATPYFSMRPTEDLLGKNDKVIAKEKPRGVFSPGHDKWDYKHSLGDRNPDLIVELADVTPEDDGYVKELGFKDIGNGLLFREGGKPFQGGLGLPYDTDAELAAALDFVSGKEQRRP